MNNGEIYIFWLKTMFVPTLPYYVHLKNIFSINSKFSFKQPAHCGQILVNTDFYFPFWRPTNMKLI